MSMMASIDEESEHIPVGYTLTEEFHIMWTHPCCYSELQYVSSGSFSDVCRADCANIDKKVAIKKLSRPFISLEDSKRTYREICLLKHMKHKNVVDLIDMFTTAMTKNDLEDLYLVSTFYSRDLKGVLESETLTLPRIKSMVYQIFCGLQYIHSAGVIHRDLKPGNIGVTDDDCIKIMDFGLARYVSPKMTGYVQTRWYRAPEIILNWMNYNQTADVWSVGCIMGEMYTQRALIRGEDFTDQVMQILNLVGTPDESLLRKFTCESAKDVIKKFETFDKQNFCNFFKTDDCEAIDILDKMLKLDVDARITVGEAMKHSFLAEYYNECDKVCAPPFQDRFATIQLNQNEWIGLAYEEIKNWTPINIR